MFDSSPLPELWQKKPQSGQDWSDWRNAALDTLQEHIYGRTPPLPEGFSWSVEVVEEGQAFSGLARRLQLRVTLHSREGEAVVYPLLYMPKGTGPFPCWLGLNFGGNHTTTPDPDVWLSRNRALESFTPGAIDGKANELSRGFKAEYWALELILRRGYAVCTCYAGDFATDDRSLCQDGVKRLFGPVQNERLANDWGNIGVWAWGLSRLIDVLQTRPEIDAHRIAVSGHSRMGKTALWAAAQDERISLAVVNNSGAGGGRASRLYSDETERIGHLGRYFPHWFCPRFYTYHDREHELPCDQHWSMALVAPRGLYLASATNDLWAGPQGEWATLQAALPAWQAREVEVLGAEDFPPQAESRGHGTAVGFHLRPGAHAILTWDWMRFLDFYDQYRAVAQSR